MKKLISAAMLCVFVAVPAWADLHGAGWDGGTAAWTRVYSQGQGGEFTLYNYSTAQPLHLSNSAYASSTRGQGLSGSHPESFQTFCLESDEFVASPMRVGVSEAFVNGSQPGSHAYQGGAFATEGDDLDPKTAYLYTQFAKGGLSGYYYGSSGRGGVYNLTRAESAGTLQRVIWKLEGETSKGFDESFMGIGLSPAQQSAAQDWMALADRSGWNGIGDVRVLQLWAGDGNTNTQFKQDQLFLTPVPGAVLLGMLGLGAAGIRLRRFA